jgi:hypothetical protein
MGKCLPMVLAEKNEPGIGRNGKGTFLETEMLQ